jgi:hypothetical protein
MSKTNDNDYYCLLGARRIQPFRSCPFVDFLLGPHCGMGLFATSSITVGGNATEADRNDVESQSTILRGSLQANPE